MKLDDIQKIIESVVTKAVIDDLKQSIGESVKATLQADVASIKKTLDAEFSKKIGQAMLSITSDPSFGSMLLTSLESTLRNNAIAWNTIKIPHNAIVFNGFTLSADSIRGGTLRQFNSQGIEDQANDIQLTVFDKGIVVENKTLTRLLEVTDTVMIRKSATVDGNLTVNGDLFLSIQTANTLGDKVLALAMGQLSSPTSRYKVPHTSVDFSGFKLNASQIGDGVIKTFASTGIVDKAKKTELMVTENGVRVAGTMSAGRLVVAEGGTIDGTLQINGSLAIAGDLMVEGSLALNDASFNSLVKQAATNVKQNLDATIPQLVLTEITKQLSAKTFDLTNVAVNGVPLMQNNTLANTVAYSNIQRLGELRDLTVLGNATLARVMTVQENKRIGINTLEPSYTVDIWDNDAQLAIYKIGKANMFIGSPRDQILSLGTNGKVALTITNDGTTIVNALRIGRNSVAFSSTVPNYSGTQGDVVFNIEPGVGKPSGWHCGGGTRWFQFSLSN